MTVEADPFDSISESASSFGVSPDDFRREYVAVYDERRREVEVPLTDHVSETLSRLGCEVDRHEARRTVEEVFFDADLSPIDGALEAVEEASEVSRTAVVSNASVEGLVEKVVDETDLDTVLDTWVSSVEVGHRKPSPEPFDEALGRLGVRPDDAVHIGDTEADVEGGERAGVTTCLVEGRDDENGYEYGYEPDYVVGTVSEATEILR